LTILHVLAAGFLSFAKPAIRLHFDADRAAAPPSFLRFEATRGLSPSTWKAIPDPKAVTLENVAIQTGASGAEGQYRFALSTEAGDFLDGRVTVSVRKEASCSPCRAGLAVRYRSPENFVGVVYDLSRSSVAVIRVEKGRMQTLASGSVTSDEPLWRTIGVDLSGPRIAVTLSGKPVLEATDPRPVPGAAGMLAEGASVVGFDELLLAPVEADRR
jgi:hypothetical protein